MAICFTFNKQSGCKLEQDGNMFYLQQAKWLQALARWQYVFPSTSKVVASLSKMAICFTFNKQSSNQRIMAIAFAQRGIQAIHR
jgi:hypothetical protein